MGRQQMASLQELGYDIEISDCIEAVSAAFANVLARRGKLVSEQELLTMLSNQKM
jgi:lipoate-protein ligase A